MEYPVLDDIEFYIEYKLNEDTQNELQQKGLACQLIINLMKKYKIETHFNLTLTQRDDLLNGQSS
jgi:hypothetical protein